MNVVERFLNYVKFDTQSDELTNLTPSTPGQMIFAQALEKELQAMGLKDISLDENGYLMATLPGNIDKKVPTVGFIAHLDTSPDMSGRHVNPRIVEKYDGGDVILNEEDGVVLSPMQFPEMKDYVGQSLIVTDGRTLLGADDKAGVAEIITAMDYLLKHPEIKHGDIRVAFNPDEEIGLGAHKFDVERFAADWAYTMDGGAIGELEFENFNAASAKVVFKGRNVHPGYAKHKMINSIRIANQFSIMLPRWETPEHTEDYEGFYQYEMAVRHRGGYPPYYFTVQLTISHPEEALAAKKSFQIARQLRPVLSDQAIVLGPTPKSIARINNRYFYQIVIKYKQEPQLQAKLAEILETTQIDTRHGFKIGLDNEPLQFT